MNKYYSNKLSFLIDITSINEDNRKAIYPFSISINTALHKITLACNEPMYIDKVNNVIIILKGTLFTVDDIEFIINHCKGKITNHLLSMKGSFSVVIYDLKKNILSIITDKVNTYKIYESRVDSHIYYYNDIDIVKSIDPQYSNKSIFWYITSGYVPLNNTIYKNTKILPRSTIYTKSIHYEKYFRYWDFYSEYKTSKLNADIDELQVIIEKSIVKRINEYEKIGLSLSGGLDSLTLLNILHQKLSLQNLHAYSYYFPNQKETNDCTIAQKTAKYYKVKIKTYPAVLNDIGYFVKNNAIYSQGIAPIADEIAFWKCLSNDSEVGDQLLFLGDELFGFNHMPNLTWGQLLSIMRLTNYIKIDKKFKHILLTELSLHEDDILEDLNEIRYLYNKFENIFDTMNYIYYDLFLTNVFTSWRQYYAGRIMHFTNPFLDDEVLDTIKKWPYSYRKNKYLFIQMIRKHYPVVLKFKKKIKVSSYYWINLLRENDKKYLEKSDFHIFHNTIKFSSNSLLNSTIIFNKQRECLSALINKGIKLLGYNTKDLYLMLEIVKRSLVINYLLDGEKYQ